jgi:cobalt-zinc-cadmium efflux system outer membrane protein
MPSFFIRRVVLFAVISSAGAVAQDSTFDLKTALQTAEINNLELRAVRQQRAIALAGLSVARQVPNPTFTFSATRDTPHESLLWDQPIEIGGKRSKRIAVAQEEQKATDIDINILSRQIRRRTREAFYRSLSAKAQTEQAKAVLDLSTKIKDIVQQRYDAGDVAQLEVIQADVELARATAEFELASQSQKSADVQLAALLNRKFDQPLLLSDRLDRLPPAESLESVTDLALRFNPDVQRTTQESAIEEKRLGLAKAQRIPNVDLQAGTDFNAPPEFNVGARGQISMALPLFYHGQGEVALSSARLQLLRLTLQAQQTNASAQVASAYYDFTAKFRQAGQYQDRVIPQTVKLEQMAEDSYQSGKSNLLTLIDAQRRLNDVRKTYIDILFSVQSSFAGLEEVVGAPLD